MIVEQIYTNNAWRNFNYLIACPETGEAIAIDPLEHEKCLSAAKRLGGFLKVLPDVLSFKGCFFSLSKINFVVT